MPNANKQSTATIDYQIASKFQQINNKLSYQPPSDLANKFQQINNELTYQPPSDLSNKFQKITNKFSYQPPSEITNQFQQITNKFSYQTPKIAPINENGPSPPAIHPQTLNKIQQLVEKFKTDNTKTATQEPTPVKNERNKSPPKVQVC